jgi:hypothetical protein
LSTWMRPRKAAPSYRKASKEAQQPAVEIPEGVTWH